MWKYRKKPPEKPSKELDNKERELFLNAFFQGVFSNEPTPEVCKKSHTPEAFQERDLFLRAMSEEMSHAHIKDMKTKAAIRDEKRLAKKRSLVDATIDLHGMYANDAIDILLRFLEREKQSGSRTVLVVHGKGAGVLKKVVWSLLDTHPYVDNFQVAPQKLGGGGAILVRMSSKNA